MLAMAKPDPVYFANHRDGALRLLHCTLRGLLQAVQVLGQRIFSKSALAFGLLGFLVCFIGSDTSSLVSAKPTIPNYDDRNSDQVTALISLLDSRDYDQREQAAEDLIEIGERAIGPLALKSFECSPEACWRIRKILEQICTRGNETVFYKTTGILQLRYDSSNAEMEKRLSVLETKWRVQRKQKAISLLRKKGAVIDDPFEGVQELAGQNPGQLLLGGPPELILINGQVVVASEHNAAANAAQKRKPKKRLSNTDAKKEIKRILGSDLEQARKIVIGDKRDTKSDEQTDQEFIEIQRQLVARRGFIAPRATITSQGVSVELGERWKGDAADLEAIADLTKVTEVKLVNQNLNASFLKQISDIKTMNRLVIENCEFNVKLEDVDWPKSLPEMNFSRNPILKKKKRI